MRASTHFYCQWQVCAMNRALSINRQSKVMRWSKFAVVPCQRYRYFRLIIDSTSLSIDGIIYLWTYCGTCWDHHLILLYFICIIMYAYFFYGNWVQLNFSTSCDFPEICIFYIDKEKVFASISFSFCWNYSISGSGAGSKYQ